MFGVRCEETLDAPVTALDRHCSFSYFSLNYLNTVFISGGHQAILWLFSPPSVGDAEAGSSRRPLIAACVRVVRMPVGLR